jgi:hypothetical protein
LMAFHQEYLFGKNGSAISQETQKIIASIVRSANLPVDTVKALGGNKRETLKRKASLVKAPKGKREVEDDKVFRPCIRTNIVLNEDERRQDMRRSSQMEKARIQQREDDKRRLQLSYLTSAAREIR